MTKRSRNQRRMTRGLLFCLLGSAILASAQGPKPTELLGEPFEVKTIWTLDGKGSWDFVKMDPGNRQLLVARGNRVQAVDIETGLVTGEIKGTHDARAIALDDHEEFGFISDGAANEVDVFDRRSFKIVARIPSGPNPRALVYEPNSGLVFAICGPPRRDKQGTFMPGPNVTDQDWKQSASQSYYEPGSFIELQPPHEPGRSGRSRGAAIPKRNPNLLDSRNPPAESVITVIDAETWSPLAYIGIRGQAGSAATDGLGRIYFNLVDQSIIVRLEAEALRNFLEDRLDGLHPPLKHGRNIYTAIPDTPPGPPLSSDPKYRGDIAKYAVGLDWRGTTQETLPPPNLLQTLPLGSACVQPQGLSADGRHMRLFVACSDSKLEVVNADTGQMVTKTPTGYGTGVVEFDAARGLIFAANGDGGGTLTIIRQHVIDNYEVVQNVLTSRHARVLAVNPGSGEVYVVTDSGESGLAVLVVGH